MAGNLSRARTHHGQHLIGYDKTQHPARWSTQKYGFQLFTMAGDSIFLLLQKCHFFVSCLDHRLTVYCHQLCFVFVHFAIKLERVSKWIGAFYRLLDEKKKLFPRNCSRCPMVYINPWQTRPLITLIDFPDMPEPLVLIISFRHLHLYYCVLCLRHIGSVFCLIIVDSWALASH